MSITSLKSFTILLILALSCVVGAQDENSISTAELMELSSISEVQYENAMSTAPIIEPPGVYIPANVNVEDNHNLLIGGISQSRILGENPALIEFADNNHAVYVPTYYSGNMPSDIFEVAKASGSKYIPTFENGLARTELQDQYYNTIFAYSGGTRTVVTAIDRQGVTAEKLVLISPMRATQSQDDYDRTIQRILNDGLVNKIEVWQSPQDQLPLIEFNQVRFEEDVDLDIAVHSIDLDSEGISAHIELFSYVSGVYSGSPLVLAFDVSPRSLKCGDSLGITYTVLDNSGSGLKQVELWCKDETNDWQEIDRNALAGENGPLSGTFTYSPLAPGKYWYGVHIIDNNDNWNDERNSNTNYQPISFEPVVVEVINSGEELPQASGTLIRTLEGSSDWIYTIAFSPDGSTLASGTSHGKVKLWDVSTGAEIRTLDRSYSSSVNCVVFSPDGSILASALGVGTILLWNVSTGTELRTLEGHCSGFEVLGIAFSPDGSILASGCQDDTIKLWDVSTGTEIRTLRRNLSGNVNCVAFSPDGSMLASGSDDVTLWDVSTGAEIRTLVGHTYGWVNCIAFSPDGSILASGGLDETVKLWDVSTGTEIRTLERDHSGEVTCVAFSPDGIMLASGSEDYPRNLVWLWDVTTGAVIGTLEGHINFVSSVAFSPDGSILASGGFDSDIFLWRMA